MLSRAGWCLATLSPSRAPWNLGFPLVSWRRARSAHRTRLQLHKSSPARGLSSPVARGIGLVSRVLQMVPMLAAGHVNGLGWDGGNARGRRATSWIAALLACALHVGIGSLIWRGMTPSPIPPAMPSDSESMFVELLAPPTPRAERSASRGESGQVAAPARVPWRRRRRRCREHSPSAPSHRVRSRCPRRRTLKNMQTDTQPAAARPRVQSEPRAGKPADAPSAGASAPASRDFGWQPSDSAAPGERARGEPVPGSRPRRRPNAPCCRARWRRPRVRLAAMRMRHCWRCPFFWLIRSRTAAASGDRRRRGRARVMRVADSHAGAMCG